MVLLALAALDLNRKCGSYSSDPVPITHPLYKPSVRDVYDVYNSIAFIHNQHSGGELAHSDRGWSVRRMWRWGLATPFTSHARLSGGQCEFD